MLVLKNHCEVGCFLRAGHIYLYIYVLEKKCKDTKRKYQNQFVVNRHLLQIEIGKILRSWSVELTGKSGKCTLASGVLISEKYNL